MNIYNNPIDNSYVEESEFVQQLVNYQLTPSNATRTYNPSELAALIHVTEQWEIA
jgi:hypothetical protein